MKKSVWFTWALLACLTAALGGVAYLARSGARLAAERDRLTQENGELRARVAAAAGAAARPQDEETARALPALPRTVPAAPAAGDTATIDRLRATLAESTASVQQLDARVQDLQVQVQKLSVDNQRLSGSETYLKEELASANRVVEAQQAELKTRNERLVQLEVAAQKLREQNSAASGRLGQIANLSAELQEVHRRRETLLNAVLRRYKEVTEQYNAMAAAMDNRAGTDQPAVAATDIARIQNSLSLAEDDLRQLNNLNAQALRLQKQIAGK